MEGRNEGWASKWAECMSSLKAFMVPPWDKPNQGEKRPSFVVGASSTLDPHLDLPSDDVRDGGHPHQLGAPLVDHLQLGALAEERDLPRRLERRGRNRLRARQSQEIGPGER